MGTGGECSDLTSLFISGPEVGCYTMKTYRQDSLKISSAPEKIVRESFPPASGTEPSQ